MLDVSNKPRTLRSATAQATVLMAESTLQRVKARQVPKGDALEIARVAAIQAAKETSRIIPFCHPLPIDFVGIEFEFAESALTVKATVKAIYKTGVEMEALTAASVAALTLYDMLKMLDESMEIQAVRLVDKRGGKSDLKQQFDSPPRAAVLVLSDRVAAGTKQDRSGRVLEQLLIKQGLVVEHYRVIPDEVSLAADAMREFADKHGLDLVLTTGGTGMDLRDCAPEATKLVIEREAPGIAEAIRAYGQERLPYAMLSRAIAGQRAWTLIVNLPGSVAAVEDALRVVLPGILHSIAVRNGAGHADTYGINDEAADG